MRCDCGAKPSTPAHSLICLDRMAVDTDKAPKPESIVLAIEMARATGGVVEQSKWLHWLAQVGYGVDWINDDPPPCTPRQLAEVYHEREDDPDREDVEQAVDEWVWVIGENTGWRE